MKILYCDDSFFMENEFSKKMKHKLEVIIKEEDINVVCISKIQDVNKNIDDLARRLTNVTFVKSCIRIKFEEHEFILNENSLVSGDLEIHPYSGSVCFVDTISKEWSRMYLELFPDQETDLASIINDEFEDFLHDILFKGQKEN